MSNIINSTIQNNSEDILATIATNTANIKISTDSVNLNVDTLEALVGTTNTLTTSGNSSLSSIDTRLDNSIGATNNTGAIGDGQSQLRTMNLGYDRTGEKARAILVDANGKIEVNNSDNETLLTAIDSVLDASLVKQTNIETLITSTNSKIDTFDAVLDASLVKQTSIESLITSTNSKIDTMDSVLDNSLTKLTNNETLLTAIDSDTNAIKTSIESLDNAVDGNYLNTNLNIAGSDVSGNSGNKNDTSIRVCIATDDIPTGLTHSILNGINTNVVAIAVDLDAIETLITSTNSKIDTADAVLDASLVKQTNIESLITSTNSKIDTFDAVLDASLVKQTAIAVDLDAIETLITSTNSKIDTADAVLDASLVKQTAIETLITSTNSKIDTFDAVLDASLVKHGNNETLLNSIDSGITDLDGVVGDLKDDNNSKLDHISDNLDTLTARIKLANSDAHLAVSLEDIGGVATQTTTAAILAKNNQIENLITSTNARIALVDAVLDASLVKQTNIETLITSSNTKLDTLETTLTEIAPRQAISAVYASASLADGGISSVIDTDDFSYMTIAAKQDSAHYPIEVQMSIDNSKWFKIRSSYLTFLASDGGSWADVVLEHPMRYVRLVNNSGVTITNLHMSYQLSN